MDSRHARWKKAIAHKLYQVVQRQRPFLHEELTQNYDGTLGGRVDGDAFILDDSHGTLESTIAIFIIIIIIHVMSCHYTPNYYPNPNPPGVLCPSDLLGDE